MRVIPILIFTIVFCACRAKHQFNKEQMKSVDGAEDQVLVSDRFGHLEKKEIVDSLTWLFYSLNYDHLARYSAHESTIITPVKCDIGLWEIVRKKDTTLYYFAPYYKDPMEQFWIYPDDYFGIVTIAGRPRCTIGGHYYPSIPMTENYADSFFTHHESLFMQYISHYQGEVSEWLITEMTRRKIATDKVIKTTYFNGINPALPPRTI